MKTKTALPLMILSLLSFNSWSQSLGIPSLRVTGEDIESDQKVLWVEGENFYQGTCGARAVFETMNKDTCKVHTKIPLPLMKSLLKISHAETRDAEVKLMVKEIDQAKKARSEVAALSKKIQAEILNDVKAYNLEISNIVNEENGTEKRLKMVLNLLKPSASNPKAAALIARVNKELSEFPKRINSVLPYNSTSYIDNLEGNIRNVENSVEKLEVSKKTVPARVKEVEDYLDILRQPLDHTMVNTPTWNKYFKKFRLPKQEVWEPKETYDYSDLSWNFKVLNIVAEYEQAQVLKNKSMGYLAHLQKINKPVSANGKQWTVVSRNHSLLGEKFERLKRPFDYYYLAEWLDSEEVENNGISKLSPNMLYTCENVFGKGWRSPTIKEIDAAVVEIKRTALGDVIGDKRVLSSERYTPNSEYVNTAQMFNMGSERKTNRRPHEGGARLCVKQT